MFNGGSKIKDPIRKLLAAIATNQPLHLPERTLQDDFDPIRKPFEKLGFLRRLDPAKEIFCPGSANARIHSVTPLKGKLFVDCDCEEGVGLIEVSKEDTERFGFDMAAFLSWLSTNMELSGTVQPTENKDVWFLGERTQSRQTTAFYFARIGDPQQASKLALQLQKRASLLLWLGESPHMETLAAPLISLPEVLILKNGKLDLDTKPIHKRLPSTTATEATDIILDDNIVLHYEGDKCFLLFERDGNAYRHKCLIRPQAARLIRFLYDVRNHKDYAFPLDEFVLRGFGSSKPSISNRFLDVNLLCDQREAEPVFHKFPKDMWGLNRSLKSCK